MIATDTAQPWSASDYATNAHFVPALGTPVVALLDPKTGERILDLGCGDGVLTEKLVAAGASVLGVDADASMLDAARARGLDVAQVDGQALDFDAEFDAVFTNAALHWMPDQAAVAAGVFRALKPGGRFVGECGGFGNIAAIRAGLRAMLLVHGHAVPPVEAQVYQTAAEYTAVLEAADFTGVHAEIIPRPTPLATGITGWLKTFRSGFLDNFGIARDSQDAFAEEVQEFLRPMLCDHAGNWVGDYIRLRFHASKPA
ncbi:MAG: class I SAM-dependent methyltransferase [Janthinobacterium lividum]